jgi:pyridoxal phosphate enzyme (YggS family)
MCEKHAQLPKDIEWHMIGHLQTNKIKYIAPFVSLIHSVDSNRLLKEIDKEAAKNDRTISCLLQVHIADEETKYGFDEKDLIQLFEAGAINSYSHVQVSGLMGMATFTDDLKKVRQEFAHLKHVFSLIQSTYFASKPSFNTLSMGMSGDYLLAIEEGSNMIRVGSTIFGERIYQK